MGEIVIMEPETHILEDGSTLIIRFNEAGEQIGYTLIAPAVEDDDA